MVLSALRNRLISQPPPQVYVHTFYSTWLSTCNASNFLCKGIPVPAQLATGGAAPFALSIFAVATAVQSTDAPLAGANVLTVTLLPLVDLDDSFEFSITRMVGLRSDLQAGPVYTHICSFISFIPHIPTMFVNIRFRPPFNFLIFLS